MTRRFPLRTTALTTAASALAALTVVAGAGAAQAQDTGDDPATDPDARVCITIETFNGHRDMCLTPAVADVVAVDETSAADEIVDDEDLNDAVVRFSPAPK